MDNNSVMKHVEKTVWRIFKMMDQKFTKWLIELTNQQYKGDLSLCMANVAMNIDVVN